MNRHLRITAAAALAVGSIGYWAQAQENKNAAERAADNTGAAISSAADKTKEVAKDAVGQSTNNAEEINDLLAQVVESALTKEGLDDMAERFVDADRNRLGQNKDALKAEALDGRIAQIQKDWKEKYGHEFDIKDEDAVYGGFAMITSGEITPESARQAGEKVEVKTDADTGAAKVEVKEKTGVDAPKANTDGQTAADKNLNDAGRNIANVTFPASHGFPELKVPLIHEATGWKIDIPDSVDAMKLRDNVQAALTHCGDMKAKWSADEKEAYRAFTHSVLTAVFDKQAEAQKASDASAPAATPAAPQ